MKSSLRLLGFLLALLPLVPAAANDKKALSHPAPLHKLTIRLIDGDGRPVPGAHVGTHAYFWEKRRNPEIADAGGFMYVHHCISDKSGLAVIEDKSYDLRGYGERIGFVAHHDAKSLVAFIDVESTRLDTPLQMTLVPECRLSGKLVSPELAKLGRKVGWANVLIGSGRPTIMSCESEDNGDFHFFVPPGNYNIKAYGTYLAPKNSLVAVPTGKRQMELILTLTADKFALLRGRPAPELRDVVAWKNGPALKLAELKGKCVLLEFWGHWCDPCVHAMTRTFDLHDRFAKQGLVVIGVHVDFTDSHIDSVEKLDRKVASIRKTLWHGRDIPYQVAIARPQGKRCTVVEDYGIHVYPSLLLIDRRGNVVDLLDSAQGGLALLRKALDDKPASDASRAVRR
jgi:thiol-disulfide isomerase/thioredoxin